MKIVEINTVCGIGSTGRIVVDIANMLQADGHECEIAYGQLNTVYKSVYRIGTHIDGFLHKVGSRLLDRHGFFSHRATKRLIEYLYKIKPDVIHLHNLHGHYLNIDLLFHYLSQEQIPVIWTLHDCWSFTGHCAYFDYVQCDKWQTKCEKCPNLKAYPPSMLIDNSSNNYRRKKEIFNRVSDMIIVTPSYWLADLIKCSLLSKHKVQVIPNGIDINVFKPTKSDIRTRLGLQDKILLLGVALGGFTGRKGLFYFLDVAKRLPLDYRIILIGVAPSEKTVLPNNIIGICQTGNVQELAEYYSAADIFVNPTLEDNFPTTNLEALACGTPVITFETGGSTEAIDSQTGMKVKKGDSSALSNAILEMNNIFKKQHEKDCRERSVRMYDKNVAFAAYLDLYKEIFNRL